MKKKPKKIIWSRPGYFCLSLVFMGWLGSELNLEPVELGNCGVGGFGGIFGGPTKPDKPPSGGTDWFTGGGWFGGGFENIPRP